MSAGLDPRDAAAGATLLDVQVQRGEPVMWWLVRPSGPSQVRRFLVVGTGQDVPDGWAYLGTFQQHGGDLVLHLFECPAPPSDSSR